MRGRRVRQSAWNARGAVREAALVVVAGCLLGVLPAPARSDPGSAPAPAVRGSRDVYERGRASIHDILMLVAQDLKTRVDAWPKTPGSTQGPGAVLVLVVDPTTSMKPELLQMRDALVDAVAEGPRGLRVGVLGAGAEWTPPGHVGDAREALTVLSSVPFDGPKNLLEAVREAAGELEMPATEPRSLVLVTQEGGDAEDDVEATRKVLKERGVTFYSVAPEAAFERPWTYDFVAREVPDLGLTQRFHPMPRTKRKGELFLGADVAFGLVPYRFELPEFPFAQAEFPWAGRGRFPVPSGFGFWSLASLSWSSGGRCFVHNFKAPGARSKEQDRTLTLYDMGFLNLFAPDLRPRSEVLHALEQDRKALAIVKIWEYLADEEAPVVTDHGTLERAGAGLLSRPMLPVRSATPFDTSYRQASEVERARATAVERRRRVEVALGWWGDEEKRATTPSDSDKTDPLRQRSIADFDLLGVQLLKIRFHWGEVIAALDTIPKVVLDGNHEARLRSEILARGIVVLKEGYRFPDVARATSFIDAMASMRRIVAKYHDTPWALIVSRGETFTFAAPVRELTPPGPTPQPKGDDKPKPPKPVPPKPPKPAPPPPPPERPSSGSGGPTTGGK